ncbi:hypothetical protein ID551_27580, partial [Klebsiella pneumoniae]|uniref:hypothetical protein n=1 Tax=Klebsiella pneumoniae TaxID=573 RepID=UPI001BCE570C
SDTARMPADAAATGNDVAAAAPARDTDGEYPQAAAPDTTPPVAPHPTRLMMLDDGLYARDEQNNWRKLENGSWVSVQAPQGVAAQ